MFTQVRRPSIADLGVAAAVVLLTVPVSVGLLSQAEPWVRVVFSVLLVVFSGCMVFRRVYPTGGFCVACLVMLASLALPNLPDGPSMIFAPVSLLYLVSLYTVVVETGARALPLAASVVGLGLAVGRTVVDPPEPLDWSALLAFVPVVMVAVGGTWAFGAYHRARAELRRRRAREGLRRERELMARELHDVVAHSLAVVVAQADAALMVLDRDPAKARAMIGTALTTGRGAMVEMRRVVSTLREEPLAEPPVRSLHDLEALVDTFRTEDVRVELVLSGEVEMVDGETARAAYRIVQESLTNALKHSPRPLRCRVEVAIESGGVVVSVRDDGPGFRATRRSSTGHGIVGMRERARGLGGRLDVTSGPSGTHVSAHLPRP
ncbi:signal transduction histidine kinase [Actinomadura pelletieri DSM 43383]|uniref:histidine kinase n=1 Tax=Actinomadura pelletieri DSM 43383 TaxID=1120940 RepID=A0A495QA49_9ACTN|nr:sensor histidine kinase [Actinomadura pelletieri]RKS68345.1 signal transduction histidine kinase [Actinomadura pelletieri DSM 43383]